jgi:hypothetical protein
MCANTNSRLDQANTTTDDSIGFNFRYANYYYLPSGDGFSEFRDLYKVYGIRFIFLVTGQAGKFDIVPLLINIGSGLALTGTQILFLFVLII